MKKFERVYYFSIIVLAAGLIIFLTNDLKKCRESRYKQLTKNYNSFISSGDRLFSFKGENKKGKKEWIHFTAYSEEIFIFVNFSTDCNHCATLIDELREVFFNREIDERLNLILLTYSNDVDFQRYPNLKVLKIAGQDIFQFGPIYPSVFAVNGAGKILIKSVGYKKGAFEELLKSISSADLKKK